MNKLLLSALLILFTISTQAQVNYMVLKKGNKTVQHFWKDSYITFQQKDGQWMHGIITKIENDSFYLTMEKITYSMMGSDTAHFSGFHYALSDVYVMPKKGLKIDYIDGQFRINPGAGHLHWYWIKSGWLFRTAAIGYTGLYLANGLIDNNLSFSGGKLGVAGAVFLAGVILHKVYKVTFRLGNKYHLEAVNTSVAL